MITAYIRGQGLQIVQTTVVEDSINYQQIRVIFKSTDWNGLQVRAHLKHGSTTFDVPVNADGYSDKFDFADAGQWSLYFHGNEYSGGEVVDRITTEEATLTVKKTGTLNNEPFTPIPPSEVERIYAKMGDLDDLETEHKDTLVGAINEAYGGGGTSDHTQLTNRDAADQHPISAITGLRDELDDKQPNISDLATIRSGAALGATAVQPEAGKGLFSGSYNDLTNKPTIPTQLSQLSGDTAHRTVTDAEKQAWNAKQNELTPDVDYATPEAVQQDISDATTDMATETWVEGKGYITADDIPVFSVNGKTGRVVLTAADLGIGSVFDLKGSVPTKTALPSTGNKEGDVWYVVDESVGYVWLNDGTTVRWEMLGMSIDLSNYVTTGALAAVLTGYVQKIAGKGLSTNDFTDAYKTKLDSAITSLVGYATEQWVEGKGYLTEHQSLAAYRTSAAQDVIDGGKQPTLVSGQNIKTFNGNSILGSGDIAVREMPSVTSADAGKFARVNDSGEWEAEAVPNAEDDTF